VLACLNGGKFHTFPFVSVLIAVWHVGDWALPAGTDNHGLVRNLQMVHHTGMAIDIVDDA